MKGKYTVNLAVDPLKDHVYEPVTPAASTDRISSPAKHPKKTSKDESRLVIRIPLTEELVMADDTGSEPEAEEKRLSEEDEEDEDEDDDGIKHAKQVTTDESIYEGENENSSVGEPIDTGNGATTRIKLFQQKVKVKADTLRTKLQGVTKRKPKQKIVVDGENGEKSRRKFGQFATLPKKFTFNAPKVNFSKAFNRNISRNSPATDADQSGGSTADETKTGRFSLPRFGFSKTSSESPKPSKSAKIGASRLSIPSLRSRTWSDASKISKPDSPKTKFMDFGTYPRIFSKRGKTAESANKSKTPPPPQPPTTMTSKVSDSPKPQNKSRGNSFRRRFFRSHTKESTPAPTEEQTATLAVEEELDESHVSKESLAEFGDSDLQEVISLSDDCRSKDYTKSVSEYRAAGVIEEIDSDEFFLREKGLSRGDVHISNYLSSEIRDVFRSNRTRSVEGENNDDNSDNRGNGISTPVRPSRTNSLRRPGRAQSATDSAPLADRFSTMPKSFGGSRPKPELDAPLENIITSQTFEPASSGATLPSTFRAPWRTAQKDNNVVTHMPPKPPSRLRMSKFSTFDTRSMIDLSRKRSQSQSGFLPTMNFSETVPKAPLRRSRTSLAGSDRDVSLTSDGRPSWLTGTGGSGGDGIPKAPLRRSRTSLAGSDRDVSLHASESRPSWTTGGSGIPSPPLRRSRMSLTTDADVEERSRSTAPSTTAVTATTRVTPPRPPPPSVTPGYATVDKSSSSASLLMPPQSPVRHRRKKSYDVIKSQEFGAFFTIPRSYCYNRKQLSDEGESAVPTAGKLPPPSRPARAYNTLGPSRPHRRRLPIREHEYGDLAEDVGSGSSTPPSRSAEIAARHAYDDEEDGDVEIKRHPLTATQSSSPDEVGGTTATKVLYSGDVIEKMKLRPLPSPPPPPRKSKPLNCESPDLLQHRRRNTDSALVPFLDRRETSVTSSNNDEFFADVSRALLASAAKTTNVNVDDVSVGVQTDPLPDGFEIDDVGSCCSTGSARPESRASSTAAADQPASRAALSAADRPTSRMSTGTEYADRPTSRNSAATLENGYAVMPADMMAAGGPVMCAQRISVNELRVGKIIVADARGQRMLGVDDDEQQSVQKAALQLRAACDSALQPQLQDDNASVQSSRVSSMYPEVDSDEDRASVLAAPTPPRRRSRPPASDQRAARTSSRSEDAVATAAAAAAAVDLSAAAADPSITELSCQLFRLCHSNVCSLFNKVVQQVVPEDTEKRRDLQAALCFLSIILAGLLILGFGNEKTIHHHHWDFQFPPANQ
ncbi:Hypothetical protein CINCED_3A011551 [Cinara cedri]|uniref:Uncharacterized protein n=1 Tax=Cinara cedri TaxID=506608 RepID=A0A5E4ND57_9HEMI|nr:Hypothetical protein CINCED_3A011551 [Cinara cedri]